MKIYTKSGDTGETGLFGGGRVSKTHALVESYGTVDELNAALGLARALGVPTEVDRELDRVQSRLFSVGADLATPLAARTRAHLPPIDPGWTLELESSIDSMTETLAPLTTFILPGGTPGGAALHVARTVCRRAERRLVACHAAGIEVTAEIGPYLNRLGDWLFTAARFANASGGAQESEWRSSGAP